MKQKFSKSWKTSKQPRKQRKYRANAPLHIKKKFVSANLSKELRKKHGKRNTPVRKGDKVKILRGKYKGKEGKIIQVMLRISKVNVEGIQIKKLDGSKVNVKMQPSNLQIIELNLDDQKRMKKLKIKEPQKEKIKTGTTKSTDLENKTDRGKE